MTNAHVASVDTAQLLSVIGQVESIVGTKGIEGGTSFFYYFRAAGAEIEICCFRGGKGCITTCPAEVGEPFSFGIVPEIAKTHFRIASKGNTILSLEKSTLTVAQEERKALLQIQVVGYQPEIREQLEAPTEEGFIVPLGTLRHYLDLTSSSVDKAANPGIPKSCVNISWEGDRLWFTGMDGAGGTAGSVPVTATNPGAPKAAWVAGTMVVGLLKSLDKQDLDNDTPVRIVIQEEGLSRRLFLMVGSVTYLIMPSSIGDQRVRMKEAIAGIMAKGFTSIEVPRLTLLDALKAASAVGKEDQNFVAICLKGAKQNSVYFREQTGLSSLEMEMSANIEPVDSPLRWVGLKSQIFTPLLSKKWLGDVVTLRVSQDGNYLELIWDDKGEDDSIIAALAKCPHYITELGPITEGK